MVICFLREAQEEKDPNVTLGLLAQEPQKGPKGKTLFEFYTLQLCLLITRQLPALIPLSLVHFCIYTDLRICFSFYAKLERK